MMRNAIAILFLASCLSDSSTLAAEDTAPGELSSIEWQEIGRRGSLKLFLNIDGTFEMTYTFRSAEVGKDDKGRDKLVFRDVINEVYSGNWRMLSSEHTLLALYYKERWVPLGIRLYKKPAENPVWQFQTVALRYRKFDRYDRPSDWIEVAPGWNASLSHLAHYPDEEDVLSQLGFKRTQSAALSPGPSALTAKIQTILPQCWSTQTICNALLVSRDERVVIENNINGPGRSHDEGSVNAKVEDWNEGIDDRYVLILRFGEKVSLETYKRMVQRNAARTKKMGNISDKLRLHSYKSISSYRPETADDKRLFNEYERQQSSIEELPTFYTEQHSIWFNKTMDGDWNFVSEEVDKECQSVNERLRSMFRSY